MENKKYIATMRMVFTAESDVDAAVQADAVSEQVAELLEEDDTFDVTQVIPFELISALEPSEIVNEMRALCDKLVSTRIKECYDLASWLHRTAWILEKRQEEGFEAAGYDYGDFVERAAAVLKKTKKGSGNASNS